MKKQIILTGAACGLLAVLPAVGGAFAANMPAVTTTDTVNVTVNAGCNVAARNSATANLGDVNPGSAANASSPAISITCNNAWKVTPSTAGLTSADKTTITSNAANAKGSQLMLKVATGNTTSSNGGTITNGFNGTSGNAINGTTAVAGTAAANAVTLTPTYYITVGQTQEPGSYTGTVTYNIAAQ